MKTPITAAAAMLTLAAIAPATAAQTNAQP